MSPSALFLVLALVVVGVQAMGGVFCPTTECKECFSLVSIDDVYGGVEGGCPPAFNPASYAGDQYYEEGYLFEYVQAPCWFICGGANWATDPVWQCAEVDYPTNDAEYNWGTNNYNSGGQYRYLCVDGPKCAAGWNNCHESDAYAMLDWQGYQDTFDWPYEIKSYADFMELYYWYYETDNYDWYGVPTNKQDNLYDFFATLGGDGCESNTKCCPHGTDVSACTDLYPNVDTYICNRKGACGVGSCSKVNGFQMGNCDGNEANGCEANLTSIATCGPDCVDCWALINDQYMDPVQYKKRMDEFRVVDWQCKNYTCAPVCMAGAYDCNGDVTDGCESFFPCCKFDEDCSQAGLPEHTAAYCMYEYAWWGYWDMANGNHGQCMVQCQDNFVDCNNDLSDGCETYSEYDGCTYRYGIDMNNRYWTSRDVSWDGNYCEYYTCCHPKQYGSEPDAPEWQSDWCFSVNSRWAGNDYYTCDQNHACAYNVTEPGYYNTFACEDGSWNCDGEFYNGCESFAPCCDFVAGNDWSADNCGNAISSWWDSNLLFQLDPKTAYYCDEYHACAIGACNENYADCDGWVMTGCENNLLTARDSFQDTYGSDWYWLFNDGYPRPAGTNEQMSCGVCGNWCYSDSWTMLEPYPNCIEGECTARHCDNGHPDPTQNYYDCNGDPSDGCESNTKCCQTDADCKNAIPFSFVATYKCNTELHACEVATCGKDGHGQQRYNCDINFDYLPVDRLWGHATGCESTTPCCDFYVNDYWEEVTQYESSCKKYFPHIKEFEDDGDELLYCDENGACGWDNCAYYNPSGNPEVSWWDDYWYCQGACELDDQGIQWYDCDNIWENGCESRVECCVNNAVLYEAGYYPAGWTYESDSWYLQMVPQAAGQPQNEETTAFCDLRNVGEYQCVKGACAIGKCMAGTADCDGLGYNGCEVNTASHPGNCGACGNSCAKNYASAGHVANWGCNGKCIAICASGWKDCNGKLDDGCEFQGTNCSLATVPVVPSPAATATNSNTSSLVSSSGVVTALLSLVLAVLLL